mmetsp:Transcript_72226/g.165736  ORF Transcript_72226/g.165736 Transcript_72226/m.165736 type:complete len:140 (+) Transcript_72226:1457-1876(+)
MVDGLRRCGKGLCFAPRKACLRVRQQYGALAHGIVPSLNIVWSTVMQCRILAVVFAEARRCASRALCSTTCAEILLGGKMALLAFFVSRRRDLQKHCVWMSRPGPHPVFPADPFVFLLRNSAIVIFRLLVFLALLGFLL